jgi:DNA repair ATPase RecN
MPTEKKQTQKKKLTFDKKIEFLIKSSKKLSYGETVALLGNAIGEFTPHKIPSVYKFIDNGAKPIVHHHLADYIISMVHNYKNMPQFIRENIYYAERLRFKLRTWIDADLNRKRKKVDKIKQRLDDLERKGSKLKVGSKEYWALYHRERKLYDEIHHIYGIDKDLEEMEKLIESKSSLIKIPPTKKEDF